MSQFPSMPMFVDAMLADTMHLTTEEFGAYHFILYATWRNNGKPIEDDHAMMARICRVTPPTWRKLRPILAKFFDLSDGTWRQKRLEKEWLYVAERAERAKANGKRGGRPRGTQEEPRKNPVGSFRDTQEESTQPQPHHDNKKTHAPAISAEVVRIIKTLDDAIAEHHGEHLRRPWPNPNDKTYAQRMIDDGADVDLICETIEFCVGKWAAEGQTPPSQIKTFEKWVANAQRDRAAALSRPTPASKTGIVETPKFDQETERWKARIAGFRKHGTWNEDHGPKPGEPDCKAPAHLLVELVAGAA